MNRFALLWSLGVIVTLKLRSLPHFNSKSFWICVLLLLVGCGVVMLLRIYRDSPLSRHPVFSHIITLDLSRSASLVLPFVAGSLWVLWTVTSELENRLTAEFHGRDLVLHGEIVGIPDVQSYRTRFDFKVDAVTAPEGQSLEEDVRIRRVRVSWYEGAPEIVSGDRWKLQVRLKIPAGNANPGSFDYTGWLFGQRIHATGYVRRSPNNRHISTSQAPLSQSRIALSERIARQGHALRHPGLLQALTTGIRQQVTADEKALLQRTGTSHLLAISGLHIGMLAGAGWGLGVLVWWLLPRRYTRVTQQDAGSAAALSAACFYAALAGFSLPTQRALIMLSTILLCRLLRRHNSVVSPVLLALFFILLIDPLAPVSAGFWLSFGAVLFLMVLSSASHQVKPADQGRGRRACRWLVAAIRVHVGLTLLMFPVTGFFFGQSSLVSPLANFVAIPLVGFAVVPPLVAWVPISLVSSTFAQWWLECIDGILGWLMLALSWMAQLPFAAVSVGGQSAVIWSLLCLVLPLAFLGRYVSARWLSAILVYPFLASWLLAAKPQGLTVTVLDVGQGLSVVIETAGHTLLYDTGGGRPGPHSMASRVVIPYFRYQGIRNLDALMVSHGDSDHAAGEGDIVDALSPDVIIGGSTPRSIPCHQWQDWQWDSVSFEILHPTPEFLGMAGAVSDNNGSCVLLISYEGTRILLPGDIEASTEAYLLNQANHWVPPGVEPVDVMISPHHGSDTSSTQAWVDAWSPGAVIHSVGYRNRWGFPHETVQMRYTVTGAENYRTDHSGAITLRFDATGRALPVIEHRQVARRLWSVHRE